jgi:hypothetical protein
LPSLVIIRRITVAGVPTDADTAPVLRDPTNSYGVIQDSSAVIIRAAGTPLVRQSAGLYQLTVDSLEAGEAYTYWIETTFDGDTTRQEKHYTAPTIAEAEPVGSYTSYDEIKTELGERNSEIVSQLDNEITDADLARIQQAIDEADAYTRRRFLNNSRGYKTDPYPGSSLAADKTVRRATTRYAAYTLVVHRQWQNGTGDEAQKAMMVGLRDRAMALYAELFGEDAGGIEGVEADEDAVEPGAITMVEIDRGYGRNVSDEYGA